MESIDTPLYKYVDILNLTHETIGKKIFILGRVHKVRKAGSLCFLILRYQHKSIQCVCHKNNMPIEKFKEVLSLNSESLIEVYGTIVSVPDDVGKVDATYYHTMEIKLDKIKMISASIQLPFSILDADATTNEEDFRNNILLDTRLNNRWIDLRVPYMTCIFKLQSMITQLFREFLLKEKFIEIHSPKLLGTASESGASVFSVKYFNKQAYLAQSPQLYKQMAISSDFDRVFEIGPVFRAENAYSRRHLCEFTGLDLEMAIKPNDNGIYDYHTITDLIWKLLKFIHVQIYAHCHEEIEYVRQRTNFTDLHIPENPLYINYIDGVNMLKEEGIDMEYTEDLNTLAEKTLGQIIKERYGSDMFILDGYPSNIRPFYTMPKESDNNFSNSYDIILAGIEISSGAQRIHDYEFLCRRIAEKGISKESLFGYLDSFKYGSGPHGGCGLGLERILMLLFGLNDVKVCSLFPRDPSRIVP
jgi:aspartyl-tRNA synthetase